MKRSGKAMTMPLAACSPSIRPASPAIRPGLHSAVTVWDSNQRQGSVLGFTDICIKERGGATKEAVVPRCTFDVEDGGQDGTRAHALLVANDVGNPVGNPKSLVYFVGAARG